ncbi:hypothetical protein F4680DRAFT_385285 [Xylaria scruposa]|nr:hypothetical protein F4680DRAFT_385285 [Xylaria scruposa]
MPVTIKTADHEASLIAANSGYKYPKAILNAIEYSKPIGDLLQSSLDNEWPPVLIADNNGFVNAVVKAFNQHHHIVIRPEDIWLAILTQFSSYVNAHGEELRSHFVAHEGQKNLVVKYDGADRYSIDFADFALKIGDLMEENIVDPELRRWITPAFSTTTQHDVVISSIVMMGMLQHYFKYTCFATCGIPSITLLGEKSDYEKILARLDKLEQYGDEPSAFTRLLKPILRRFMSSFDEPNRQEVRDFWRDICSVESMSGSDKYNGWISAFCFWDSQGKSQLSSQSRLKEWYERDDDWLPALCLDDIYYGYINSDQVPPGYTTLPVKIIDHGTEIEAEMISGSVGINCTSSGRKSAGQDGVVGIDTMQPHSAWFIYEKGVKGDKVQDTSAIPAESIAKIDLLLKELNNPGSESGRVVE